MLNMRTPVAALILIALILLAFPAFAANQVGVVQSANGECVIIRDSQSLAAEPDQPILLKDELTTGPGAQLSVLFKDQSTLTLDESSRAAIDTYVFDDSNANLLFKFTQGTFRAVTGELVKANPEGFNMETPLATLGIRGSDIYAIVQPDGEEAGAIELGEGHALEVKTARQTVRITESGMRVRISVTGIIFQPTPIPPSMFNSIIRLGTASKPVAPAPAAPAPTVAPAPTLKTTPTVTKPIILPTTPQVKQPEPQPIIRPRIRQ